MVCRSDLFVGKGIGAESVEYIISRRLILAFGYWMAYDSGDSTKNGAASLNAETPLAARSSAPVVLWSSMMIVRMCVARKRLGLRCTRQSYLSRRSHQTPEV